MDKQKVKNLRGIIHAALKPLEAEHGIAFHIGSAHYTDNSVKYAFEIMESKQGEPAQDFMELTFRAGCYEFNLTPDDYGQTFQSNGKTFTISGLKPNNRKYPVIATGPGGKQYKFPANDVVRKVRAA